MTLRALAGKWVPAITEVEDPNARSFISAASATAPNPLAQRTSISRRVSGRGVKRPQCIRSVGSVDEDEFLDVEQDVGQVGPHSHVAYSSVGGLAQRLALRVEESNGFLGFLLRRRAGEHLVVHPLHPLPRGRTWLSEHLLRPHL